MNKSYKRLFDEIKFTFVVFVFIPLFAVAIIIWFLSFGKINIVMRLFEKFLEISENLGFRDTNYSEEELDCVKIIFFTKSDKWKSDKWMDEFHSWVYKLDKYVNKHKLGEQDSLYDEGWDIIVPIYTTQVENTFKKIKPLLQESRYKPIKVIKRHNGKESVVYIK